MKLKIISDGTNAGTKLIDEDTGEMIQLVQKLTWQCNAEDLFSTVTVELINIPVEIVTKADVELLDYDIPTWKLKTSKNFEKEIRIVSASKDKGFPKKTTVHDVQTNEQVGAITEVKWEATPDGTKAKVKRIKFDHKDW